MGGPAPRRGPSPPGHGDDALVAGRLACNEEAVGSTPTVSIHPSLRSVNGKHAPFVRPKCGFDSCRRLLTDARSSADLEHCSATAEAAGSNPAGRSIADVAHREERRSATPKRPVRSGPSASEARGVTGEHAGLQTRKSRFESWRACSSRAGAARLSQVRAALEAVRFDSAIPTALHDRDVGPAAGRNGSGYRIRAKRRGFESRPEHLGAPVAHW